VKSYFLLRIVQVWPSDAYLDVRDQAQNWPILGPSLSKRSRVARYRGSAKHLWPLRMSWVALSERCPKIATGVCQCLASSFATEPQFFEDSINIEVICCNKFSLVISFNQASGPCISKLRLQLCYLFFIYFEIFIESSNYSPETGVQLGRCYFKAQYWCYQLLRTEHEIRRHWFECGKS